MAGGVVWMGEEKTERPAVFGWHRRCSCVVEFARDSFILSWLEFPGCSRSYEKSSSSDQSPRMTTLACRSSRGLVFDVGGDRLHAQKVPAGKSNAADSAEVQEQAQ